MDGGGTWVLELPALRPRTHPRVLGRQLAPRHAPLPVERTAALPGGAAVVAVPGLLAALADARESHVHQGGEPAPPVGPAPGPLGVLSELAPRDLVAEVDTAAALAAATVGAVARRLAAVRPASLARVLDALIRIRILLTVFGKVFAR